MLLLKCGGMSLTSSTQRLEGCMSDEVFRWLVLVGLFAIGVEAYQIHKTLKNYYRICRPIIEDFYKRNPDAKIPHDKD
jgi:hypothetical protein